MKRIFLVTLLLLPLRAQLALYSFDGTNDTAVGSTYSFGTVAAGATNKVRFHVKNTSASAVNNVVIGTPRGAGFSLAAVNGSLGQNTLAPQAELEFTIAFAAPLQSAIGTYSASLQITSDAPTIGVILLANLTPAPVITVFPPCTQANNGVAFANTAIGSTSLCNFAVQNQNTQPISITIAVAGDAAFQAPANLANAATLSPGDAITFAIQFTPACGTLNYNATLTVNGQSFPLTGTGLTPPLPTPVLSFDTTNIASAEQHSISMILPAPAACAASGNLNLNFSGVVPDGSIFFLSGSTRTLPFTVAAGSTQVLISGQPSAMFQTGTTAGTITFTLSGTALSGNSATTLTIAPLPVTIETASASNQRTGELDVQIVGFDNTYSAGPMSFTFYDPTGKTIGQAIAADFSSNFTNFYAAATTGSSFLMRVSFPVQGDQTQVAKVQVTLKNNAGQTQTGMLTFQ